MGDRGLIRVRRIATVEAYRKYEADLKRMIPKYLAKSGCEDDLGDIMKEFKYAPNTDLICACIVEHDGKPKGFVVARVSITVSRRTITVEHVYAPMLWMASRLYKLVSGKLCRDYGIPESNVYYVTHRDPQVWIRYAKREGYKAKIHGYIMKEDLSNG